MTRSGAAAELTGDLFAAIDRQDAAAFIGFLTDDAVFRFGSAPPVNGREAIQAAVDGFFGTIRGCSHRLMNTVEKGSTLVCEGEVTYRRQDDTQITLPFANVLEYEDGLIAHYKIYIDISPLYSA